MAPRGLDVTSPGDRGGKRLERPAPSPPWRKGRFTSKGLEVPPLRAFVMSGDRNFPASVIDRDLAAVIIELHGQD